jgi:cyanate permease
MTAITLLCLIDSRSVSSRSTGSASGLYFTAGEMGGVLGSVSIGVLYDATGGFDAGLYLVTAVCLALLVLLASLRRVVV